MAPNGALGSGHDRARKRKHGAHQKMHFKQLNSNNGGNRNHNQVLARGCMQARIAASIATFSRTYQLEVRWQGVGEEAIREAAKDPSAHTNVN